ncbi:MAG: hypothetical protein ACQEP1_01185 [Nanobdellota archaeon]
MDYVKALKDSYEDLKEHYILFTPIIIAVGLFVLLLIFLGILYGVFSMAGLGNDIIYPVLIGIGSLMMMGIMAYIQAMQYGVISEVLAGKNPGKEELWSFGRSLWKRYLGFIVLISLLYGLPFLAFNILATLKTFVITIILFILYSFFFSLALFFVNPLLVENGFVQSIADSFRMLRDDPGHTAASFAIVSLSIFALNTILNRINIFPFMQYLVTVIGILAFVALWVYLNVFIYRCYKKV